MKKTLFAFLAVLALTLTSCSAAESASSEVTDSPTAEAPESSTSETPEASTPAVTVVTYKVAAMYEDESPAPVNVAWNAPLREFADTSGNWEESSTKFDSGDYLQVLATPSDSGVTVQCAIYINGEKVDFTEVEDSSGRAECKYTLP